MKMIQMTKLVSGYIPTRVFVNPDKILYVEAIIQRRSQGGDKYIEVPKGARLHFGGDDSIDVSETPDAVLQALTVEPQVDEAYEAMQADLTPGRETYEEWEARRERIADAVYGSNRG